MSCYPSLMKQGKLRLEVFMVHDMTIAPLLTRSLIYPMQYIDSCS